MEYKAAHCRSRAPRAVRALGFNYQVLLPGREARQQNLMPQTLNPTPPPSPNPERAAQTNAAA